MSNLLFGSLLGLHGFVHLLYFGQNVRVLELQPGMTWLVDSWLFSEHFSQRVLRILAAVLCILTGMGFLIGGVGFLFSQAWTTITILTAATLSTLHAFIWDGRKKHLDGQGGIIVDQYLCRLVFRTAISKLPHHFTQSKFPEKPWKKTHRSIPQHPPKQNLLHWSSPPVSSARC